MNRFFAVLVGLMVILPFGGALAKESATPQEKFVTLEEVVVTATRLEEAVSSVPANVSVITEGDIADSTAKDVADLLRTETGVHVKDVTGNRRNYTVDLRGFGETAGLNTLVLVDGRRTNQADLSGVDWTQIPLERVERIEIIRGGRASVFYGDNAAGGVINIITKRGDKGQLGGEIQYGSYDTYKASAYASGSVDGLTYSFSGSYLDTQGYRDNSANETKDFGADLGYAFSEKLTVDLSSGYHKDTAGLPGAIKESDYLAGASRTDSVNPDDYTESEDYYVKAGTEAIFMTNGMMKMDASYRKRNNKSYATGDWGYYIGDTEIDILTVGPQVLLEENLLGCENSLNAGVDYTNSKEDITNTSEFFGFLSTGTFDLKKENYGYYLHDELTVTPEFSVSGGYRYDTANYRFSSAAGTVTTDFDESLFTVGINYRLKPKSNIYMSYARSYRYPVLDEVFSFITGDIDSSLTPQTSLDYEIGVRYALTDNTMVGLNLFYIKTEDEIFYNPNSYANQNMDGDTVRQGIEMTAERRFVWGQLGVNYTYTETDIDGGEYDGSSIPDAPEHQSAFNLLVDYWKPFSVALNGKYVGKRVFISDWSNSFSEQDDFFVMNAKLIYAWKNVTAFVNIDNLLNTDYAEYGVLGGYPIERAFYPSPERNFLMGLTLAF